MSNDSQFLLSLPDLPWATTRNEDNSILEPLARLFIQTPSLSVDLTPLFFALPLLLFISVAINLYFFKQSAQGLPIYTEPYNTAFPSHDHYRDSGFEYELPSSSRKSDDDEESMEERLIKRRRRERLVQQIMTFAETPRWRQRPFNRDEEYYEEDNEGYGNLINAEDYKFHENNEYAADKEYSENVYEHNDEYSERNDEYREMNDEYNGDDDNNDFNDYSTDREMNDEYNWDDDNNDFNEHNNNNYDEYVDRRNGFDINSVSVNNSTSNLSDSKLVSPSFKPSKSLRLASPQNFWTKFKQASSNKSNNNKGLVQVQREELIQ